LVPSPAQKKNSDLARIEGEQHAVRITGMLNPQLFQVRNRGLFDLAHIRPLQRWAVFLQNRDDGSYRDLLRFGQTSEPVASTLYAIYVILHLGHIRVMQKRSGGSLVHEKRVQEKPVC
jgi:hypothetical protein